jgi:hypothetical protein
MSNSILKKGILNTVAATGTNVLVDTATNSYYVGSNVVSVGASTYGVTSPATAVAPLTEVPLPRGSVKTVTFQSSATEVQQGVFLGVNATTGAQEVINANQQYKIMSDIFGEKYETYNKSIRNYGIKAQTNLTGSADLDRANVFTALANQINADTLNYMSASLVSRVAFTAGASGTGATALANASGTNVVIAGSAGLQATSLATANIAYLVITSGTIAAGTAAGYAYVYNVSATWSATSYVTTFTDAVTSENITITTAAIPTAGQGLYLLDDAGYYQPSSAPTSMVSFQLSRYGASTVFAPATQNAGAYISVATTVGTSPNLTTTTSSTNINPVWSIAEPIVVRAAVYSKGIGSSMIKSDPFFYYTGEEIVSGDGLQMIAFGGAIDTTKNYTRCVIEVEARGSWNGLTGGSESKYLQYVIYADESNGTNLTAFKTALTALITA